MHRGLDLLAVAVGAVELGGDGARFHRVLGSSRRRPSSASLIRPAALMRGPRPKPQVIAVGRSRAAAASSRAAMPGRARRAITRSPWLTRARLSPRSGITSHTVASATRSSSSRRSGSGRVAKKPAGAGPARWRSRP